MDGQPLLKHFIELRQRLILCLFWFLGAFFVCYFYSENIFDFLVKPLASVIHEKGNETIHRMIYTGVTEAFLTYIKVSLFSAAFISFPLIVIQIWRFIAPGLYYEEKKIFLSLLIATPVLFLLGAAFAYFFVFPLAYDFFLSFEIPGSTGTLPIQLEARVSEYLSFVMRLIFSFGICFELPVILMILASIGIVTSTKLKKQWRFAIIGIFILAAFITPPDILSMIVLALPLIFLYGLSILMVRVIENRKYNDYYA